MNIEYIGGVASFLTTVAFLPQVWRVLRTRDTRAISLGMYAIFTVGVILWWIYGLLTWNMPILLGNSVTVVSAVIILCMKWRCG